MKIVNIERVGSSYRYTWPDNSVETYPSWIEYLALAENGEHRIRIGFCIRQVYGRERSRVTVWIDGYPNVEFFGADDFDASGEVLSEIRVRDDKGEHMPRYPEEPVPERYAMFNIVGLPTRVKARGIHRGWAVAANVSDHRTIVALAALRLYERA